MKKLNLAIIGQGRSGKDIHGKYYVSEKNVYYNVKYVVDADEYRLPAVQGKGRGRKVRAPKFDSVPTFLNETYILREPRDYLSLLPPLPDIFTRSDLAKAAKIDMTLAYGALTVLCDLGALTPLGKEGRSYKYKISDEYK